MKCKINIGLKSYCSLIVTSQLLINGSELNDSIIVAGQLLPAKQFPHVNGFQDTILINGLKFLPVEKDGVQILDTGKRLGSLLSA